MIGCQFFRYKCITSLFPIRTLCFDKIGCFATGKIEHFIFQEIISRKSATPQTPKGKKQDKPSSSKKSRRPRVEIEYELETTTPSKQRLSEAF